MMFFGISSMMWLARLSALLWLTTAEVPQPEQKVRGHRHVVPLHRQRVPVRNDDEVVSFKSVYFGTIFLGAPEVQTFTVVFDTGSGHLIVPSVACRTESCLVHNRYNHKLSGVGAAIDHEGAPIKPGAPRDQITIAFGTGEITGQFARDRLCLSTTSRPAFTNAAEPTTNSSSDASEDADCIDMRIVTATSMSHEPFASFSFDGVLGLGLDSLALAPEFSFFGMLASQGNLEHASFGVFLADNDDDFSEICFGGHNPERVGSELTWADVAMPELGYWQVRIKAIRIGNRTLDFCADGQCRGVVDTGTSLIAVPGNFADELFEELERNLQDPPSSEMGSTDCSKAIGDLLSFDIEGATLALGPGDYARAAVQMSQEDGFEEEVAAQAVLEGNAPTKAVCKGDPSGFKGKIYGMELEGCASYGANRSNDVWCSDYDVRQGLRAGEVCSECGECTAIDGVSTSKDEPGDKAQEASCYPTLMPIDLPEPLGPKLFILGEPVLRKYYTVYDWDERRIGFGLALQKSSNAEDDSHDLGHVGGATGESKREPLLTIV